MTLCPTKSKSITITRPTRVHGVKTSACGTCVLEPPIPVNCCATCYPCIYICNENAAHDDDWKMYVNSTYIGMFTSEDRQDAVIALPAIFAGKTVNGATSFGCSNPSYFSWIYTDTLDVILRRYSFVMKLDRIRGNSNAGTVKILCAKLELDDTVTVGPVGGSFTYGDPTPYVVGAQLRYSLQFNRA